MLSFLGRGSGLSPEHTNAFFTDEDNLIFIDFSMTSFSKLAGKDIHSLSQGKEISHIYIIVTHTHSDHISGIPMFIFYSHFILHIPVTVAVPSEEIKKDMVYWMERMEGLGTELYDIVLSSSLTKWVKAVIPTEHTPELKGKCFGYQLTVDGTDIVYTGDTNTLVPFKPYIEKSAALYTEISFYKSDVHLWIDDILDYLQALTEEGKEVYIMHLDDEDEIEKKIAGTSVKKVRLYKNI